MREDHRVRVGAEKRRKMLAQLSDAALQVMAENGPEGVTVDAIVQAAEVSRGTFYKYFSVPEDLIAATGAELAQDLIVAIAPVLDTYDDPAERLTAAFRMTLQLAKDNSNVARFIVRAGWPARGHVPAFYERSFANIATGINRGRFRSMPIVVAQAILTGTTIGMLAALLEPDPEAELERSATIALLEAFGLDQEDAAVLADMPLKPIAIPSAGLLSRARQT